jgi:hypothetical protein
MSYLYGNHEEVSGHKFDIKLRGEGTYLARLVQNCKPISSHKNSTLSTPFLPIHTRIFHLSSPACSGPTPRLRRQPRQLIQPIVARDGNNHRPLRWVETERPRGHVWASEFPDAQQADVRAGVEVVCSYVLVADVVERVGVHGKGGTLALEFEDDQTVVVSCE